MKILQFLSLGGLMFILACSGPSSKYKGSPNTGSSSPSNDAVASTKDSDYFTEKGIQETKDTVQPQVEDTTKTQATVTPTKAETPNISAVAAQTINDSNLSEAQKAAMNAKVQSLVAAKGDNAAMAAAANVLTSAFTANIPGVKGNIPGLGLVDVAGIVAAVQDLIAAIVAADAAGIKDAIMDLIAAIA
ncbi:MAG: hypothetical protein NTX25_12005 [Proteobacteria bacterium]|nr:hypothetical protein [Pseudomonadota bacterium]